MDCGYTGVVGVLPAARPELVRDADGGGGSDAGGYHEGQGTEVLGYLVGCQLVFAHPADHDGGEAECRDLQKVLQRYGQGELELAEHFPQVYRPARGEPDELAVLLYPEEYDQEGYCTQNSGYQRGPGRSGHSECGGAQLSVDEHPVEEDVEDVRTYRYPHLVAGVADALGEEADVEEGDHGDESRDNDEIVLPGVPEHFRVLTHPVHEGADGQHDAGEDHCHDGVEGGRVAQGHRHGPSVTLAEVLSYHRGHSLREAYREDQPDHDDGVGEGHSRQLGRAEVPDHDVVRQLHQHLPCLGNHHWEGHFQVAFIERYVFS